MSPARTTWWSSLGTIVRLEWLGAELHTWQRWAALAVPPITYLGLLGVGLSTVLKNDNYLGYILPGVIVMQALSGVNRVVARTVTERRWGLAAFKLQAGVSRSAYILGMLTPGTVAFFAQALVLLAIGVVLDLLPSTGALLLVLAAGILASVFWGCLGFCAATVVRSYQTRDFLLAMTIMPLTFSAPVFYPLDSAPQLLQLLGRVNPLTYQVGMARGATGPGIGIWDAVVTIGTTIAALVAAVALTQRMRELSFEG